MGAKIGSAIVFATVWLRDQVSRFTKDQRAVSTVEYALIIVAVIAIVGGAAAILGDQFQNLFEGLGNEIDDGLNEARNAG